jgi:hypothetical protein
MKFTLVLDHRENSELSDDLAKDIARTAYKSEASQRRRIYIEFMHGG